MEGAFFLTGVAAYAWGVGCSYWWSTRAALIGYGIALALMSVQALLIRRSQ